MSLRFKRLRSTKNRIENGTGRLKEKTISNAVQTANQVMREVVGNEIMGRNPFADVKAIALVESVKREALTPEQRALSTKGIE